MTADEPQYLLSAPQPGRGPRPRHQRRARASERWRAVPRGRRCPRRPSRSTDGREVSPHDPLLPVLLAVPDGARRLGRRPRSPWPCWPACWPPSCVWVGGPALRRARRRRRRWWSLAFALVAAAHRLRHPGVPGAAGRPGRDRRRRRAHRAARPAGPVGCSARRSSPCRGWR